MCFSRAGTRVQCSGPLRVEGEAKLKYFQHAGALLTADVSDDELIKFESVPDGYVLKVP